MKTPEITRDHLVGPNGAVRQAFLEAASIVDSDDFGKSIEAQLDREPTSVPYIMQEFEDARPGLSRDIRLRAGEILAELLERERTENKEAQAQALRPLTPA